MTGRPRRCRMPCRGPSSTVSRRLGVTHQALELADGPLRRRTRRPRTAPRASRRGGLAAGRAAIDEHAPAAQLPARPMLTSPSALVRVSRASVRRVPSTKATRRERSAALGRCATNAPPSSTSSHSTACAASRPTPGSRPRRWRRRPRRRWCRSVLEPAQPRGLGRSGVAGGKVARPAARFPAPNGHALARGRGRPAVAGQDLGGSVRHRGSARGSTPPPSRRSPARGPGRGARRG